MEPIFYDTEFLERGADHPIDLISIGMTDEQGNTLYAVNADAPWHLIGDHHWLPRNVLPHLPGSHGPYGWRPDYHHPDVLPRHAIAQNVRRFVLAHTDPELIAWYADYDHVVLCQLFGTMAKLPTGFPRRTRDLAQDHARLGSPLIPTQSQGEHHALADAQHVRTVFHALGLHQE